MSLEMWFAAASAAAMADPQARLQFGKSPTGHPVAVTNYNPTIRASLLSLPNVIAV
jgi:hypothetical protein